ncbi:RtcB family protein [Desulfosarcina sp. OttesenSCG-928-G10]|nr:RtcB family protein [Desulfosarcina sp. OttesenSCG-928-G10]MDL2321942.1 RtcB family protein [Desulfosarcina sp. OttesenSCG-928-B08]
MAIRPKELTQLGLRSDIARSLAVNSLKPYRYRSKDELLSLLRAVVDDPDAYKSDPIWGKLAEHLSPSPEEALAFRTYALREEAVSFKTYGNPFIESLAKQQMQMAMRLPVAVAGALMADAHPGYGLPVGGVLATENQVIPYAVGVDIGCRMSLSVLDSGVQFARRYTHQIKAALRACTHFGMDGGLPFRQEHEILDCPEFFATDLLKRLHGKAVRQLGSSGGGNHFVEFGELTLFEDNVLGLSPGTYAALVSHSGSRGMGATIATAYSEIARDQCRLPRGATNFAWLDLDSEAGAEYWLSMNLAGDFAKACHEQIHKNLTRELGVSVLATLSNHHNFAWKEDIGGKPLIVHRKGATPAGKGVAGFIPGSMASPGYLVVGCGEDASLSSASHGAGRTMSRQKAKESFTRSAMRKALSEKGVTLMGGSLEETPSAYKDIDQIMACQTGLVTVHGKFMPRIVRMNKE